MPPALRRIERGEGSDALHLVLANGEIVILHGHGLHADEAFRTRDRALQILNVALQAGRCDPT